MRQPSRQERTDIPPRHQGYNSYLLHGDNCNEVPSCCLFVVGSADFDAWQRGWNDAKRDKQYQKGGAE